jgi:hypothetical protein
MSALQVILSHTTLLAHLLINYHQDRAFKVEQVYLPVCKLLLFCFLKGLTLTAKLTNYKIHCLILLFNCFAGLA